MFFAESFQYLKAETDSLKDLWKGKFNFTLGTVKCVKIITRVQICVAFVALL